MVVEEKTSSTREVHTAKDVEKISKLYCLKQIKNDNRNHVIKPKQTQRGIK